MPNAMLVTASVLEATSAKAPRPQREVVALGMVSQSTY